MQRLICGLLVITFAGLASGCYVAPPYSYVRGTTYTGAAYYGEGPAVVYGNSYYGYPYDPYYYGCCWAPGVAVGGVWYRDYGGRRYYRGDYRGRASRGNGQWHGQRGNGGHRSDHRGDGH
jgi:hypothetical protein